MIELSPERQRLYEGLQRLANRTGGEPLFENPLLLPTPAYFPDGVPRTVGQLRALIDRLMGFAGMPELDIVVDVYDPDRETPLYDGSGRELAPPRHDTAAYFAGIVDGRCHFGLALHTLQDDELLLGALAHEVAHAYRALHDLEAKDRDIEEQLTDLTTIYLGFGVLTTASVFDIKTRGSIEGTFATHQTSVRKSGYLKAEDMAFLLALQLAARPADPDLTTICDHLPQLQALELRSAYKRLRKHRGALGRSFLDAAEAPAEADPFERVEGRSPLEPAEGDELELFSTGADPAHDHEMAPDGEDDEDGAGAQPTGDTYRMRYLTPGMGLFAGLVLFFLVAVAARVHVGISLVGALLGWFLGPLLPWYVCTAPHCGASMGPTAPTCLKCHRRVVGTVKSREEIPEEEE